jgi:ribA/ribD-fused uncharacterized protein
MAVLICKVRDEHGWLGNMAPYPVEWNGKLFRTTEALFQSLRFQGNDAVVEVIRSEKSPMAAKFAAKKHKDQMKITPCGEQDVENMQVCLGIKLGQHPELIERLLETGDEQIVEDCSKRKRGSSLFWGAALIGDKWEGRNMLGKLWMELRNELHANQTMFAV